MWNVIAAEWTKARFLNSKRDVMGHGHISLRPFPQGTRCENAQLDFKETQHGFSPRFGGMQTRALLKQYWGAVSFIYHDKEKHRFFS